VLTAVLPRLAPVLTLLAAVLTLLTSMLSLLTTVLPLTTVLALLAALAAALPASALLRTTVLPAAGRTMLPTRLLAGALLRLPLRLRTRIVALRWIAVRHEKSPVRVETCAARSPHDPT
jgi:hypothetical protein